MDEVFGGSLLTNVSGQGSLPIDKAKGSERGFDVLGSSFTSIGTVREGLEVVKVLRDSFVAIFRVGLLLIVAVFNAPFRIFIIVQVSGNSAGNGSSLNVSPLFDATGNGNFVELLEFLDLK